MNDVFPKGRKPATSMVSTFPLRTSSHSFFFSTVETGSQKNYLIKPYHVQRIAET